MTRTKVDVDSERDLLLGMILSDDFMNMIVPILDVKLLVSPYSRLVAGWCLQYFSKYEAVPKNEIQFIYEHEKSRLSDAEEEYVHRLLTHVSRVSEQLAHYNPRVHADKAELYLKERKLQQLNDQLSGHLLAGAIAEAEHDIASFERVSRPSGEGVDVLVDDCAMLRAMTEHQEPVLSFDGAIGSLIGVCHYGDLIAIAGAAKRGKTWWLLYFVITALNQGLSVVFISCEMSEEQVLFRLAQMFTGMGTRDHATQIPFFVPSHPDGWEVQKRSHKVTRIDIDGWKKARDAFVGANRGARLRVLTFPQDTATVKDVVLHLENLEQYEGFIPHMVVVDYADILASEADSPREYRHRIDHTWKRMRRAAQDRYELWVTATQTGRDTFKKDTHADDVSEDIRKVAHVAKMIGLNKSPAESKLGLMRLSTLVERHDQLVDDLDEVVVTQCLSIGKPCLDSRFKKEIKGVFDGKSKS